MNERGGALTVSIWKEFSFDAAHRLPFLPGSHRCHALHGHTYVVRLVVGGDMHSDWLIDFAQLKGIWEQTCGIELDHNYLNDVEGLESPTAEVIALWIAKRMMRALPPLLHLESVEVRESPSSGAIARAVHDSTE